MLKTTGASNLLGGLVNSKKERENQGGKRPKNEILAPCAGNCRLKGLVNTSFSRFPSVTGAKENFKGSKTGNLTSPQRKALDGESPGPPVAKSRGPALPVSPPAVKPKSSEI